MPSQGTQTKDPSKPDSVIEAFLDKIKSIGFVELAPSGFIIIALVVLLLVGNRRYWLKADVYASTFFGIVWALFAERVLGHLVVGNPDEAAIFAGRLFGCSILGVVPVWCKTLSTRDGSVNITLMLARVMSTSCILMSQIYYTFLSTPCQAGSRWDTDKMIFFGILGTLSWLIGSAYYLMRSHDFSMYPQHNVRINLVLHIDAWLGLVMAVLLIAFPEVVLEFFFPSKVFNCVHTHTIRGTGAVLLNHTFIALYAPGFLHEKDKKSYFTGRFLAYLLLLAPVIYGLFYQQFSMRQGQLLLLVTAAIPICAIIGIFSDGTYGYRSTKTKSQ